MGKEEVSWQKFAEAFDDFLELPSDEDLSNEDFKRVNLNLKVLLLLNRFYRILFSLPLFVVNLYSF